MSIVYISRTQQCALGFIAAITLLSFLGIGCNSRSNTSSLAPTSTVSTQILPSSPGEGWSLALASPDKKWAVYSMLTQNSKQFRLVGSSSQVIDIPDKVYFGKNAFSDDSRALFGLHTSEKGKNLPVQILVFNLGLTVTSTTISSSASSATLPSSYDGIVHWFSNDSSFIFFTDMDSQGQAVLSTYVNLQQKIYSSILVPAKAHPGSKFAVGKPVDNSNVVKSIVSSLAEDEDFSLLKNLFINVGKMNNFAYNPGSDSYINATDISGAPLLGFVYHVKSTDGKVYAVIASFFSPASGATQAKPVYDYVVITNLTGPPLQARYWVENGKVRNAALL